MSISQLLKSGSVYTGLDSRLSAGTYNHVNDIFSSLALGENAITGTATALLNYNNTCVATSANYIVTLPSAASNKNAVIGIRIDPTSTYLVTLQDAASAGIDYVYGSTGTPQTTRVMWTGEDALLYSNGTIWTKIAGQSIPMMAQLGFSTNQTFANSAATLLTWTTALQSKCPAAFITAATPKITILRPGLYDLSMTAITNNNNASACTINGYIYKNAASIGGPGQSMQATSFGYLSWTKPQILAVNDYLQPYGLYTAGTFATTVFFNDSATPIWNSTGVEERVTW